MGTNDQPGVDSPKTPLAKTARQTGWRQLNVDLRPFDEVCNEHQYLLASLQRQDARIQALLGTLCSVQTQQQVQQSAGEARKLRKEVGFVQSKIADAEQQERLINGRLVEVRSEMQRRNRLVHLQYLQQQQQQQQQQMAQEQAQINADALSPLSGSAISPLAPIFRPRKMLDTESSGLSADRARLSVGSESTLDDGKVDEEACQSAEEQDAHKQVRVRRGSWSMATDSSQTKQKRMSLPPRRSVWPDDNV
ncbi:hypothetical protein CMQ_601 [Grosmannia clavigera kw1407]|uniref:Uncharacterized protein n=1 Tax=Grosmannia clavigera (strain kw1407 / UAMH 11150) TaxID=655863 RepID=F0XFH1_GROCL|nr:uncharacterized protein CMQ_601 [Grosmannia clavigera kw1407]EFX03673.1 hypothetical protein CMQ_601 [Grosmannia clavigera kw1407]